MRAVAERRYRQFVEAGLGQTAPPHAILHSRLVVGDGAVPPRVRDQLRGGSVLAEIPREQRFAMRPPLATVFAGVTSGGERDVRCVQAVRDHGYTMKAVAQFLGVHYMTVSRALLRGEAALAGPAVLDCET